jgi:hypothetical protein
MKMKIEAAISSVLHHKIAIMHSNIERHRGVVTQIEESYFSLT